MSEDQLRWERLEDELRKVADAAADVGGEVHDAVSIALGAVANAIAKAADHPAPDAVPELPEWLANDGAGSWRIDLPVAGYGYWIGDEFDLTDLDRIAEACRILAARERARRAGS